MPRRKQQIAKALKGWLQHSVAEGCRLVRQTLSQNTDNFLDVVAWFSTPLCVAVTSNSTDAGLFCCVTGVAVTGNSTDAGLRCVTGRRVLG